MIMYGMENAWDDGIMGWDNNYRMNSVAWSEWVVGRMGADILRNWADEHNTHTRFWTVGWEPSR